MKPQQLTESEMNFLKATAQKRLKEFMNDPKKKEAQDESFIFAQQLFEKLNNSTVIFIVQRPAA